MKCPKCGTENQGNICIKCGNHIFDNNLENSIFFKNIGDSIKSIENTSKEIMQEKEDNFNNQDKQLINEKINENKSELNQESKNQNLFDSNIHNVPNNSISSDEKDKLEQNLDEMFENVISKENENNEKSNRLDDTIHECGLHSDTKQDAGAACIDLFCWENTRHGVCFFVRQNKVFDSVAVYLRNTAFSTGFYNKK